MKYFDHDTDACKDELIQALRLERGGAAVDAYWAVLEMIYRDETDLVLGKNQPLTKSVTHWLCTDWETLEGHLRAMSEIGLMDVSENADGTLSMHSERARRNIESYKARVEAARQNGKKGGRKPKSNRSQTKAKPNPNPTLTKPKTKEKEKEKVLDSYNSYPNTSASGGADADDSAPPSADSRVPCCPLCGSSVRFDPATFKWRCKLCGEIKEPDFREAVA